MRKPFLALVMFLGPVLAIPTGDAEAVPRDCPAKSQWDASEGSCVKIKKARKSSPEELFQSALKDLDAENKKAKPARGVTRLKRACAQRHGQACHALGYLHRIGRALEASAKESLRFYTKACDLKVAKGCIGAAALYSDGLFGKSEHSKAIALLEKACSLSSGRGCFDLADKHRQALGTKRNTAKAGKLYRKGLTYLTAGCPDSVKDCEYLGQAYFQGRGTTKNLANAFVAWKKGCEKGSGQSCRFVAAVHRTGNGAAKDPLRAREYFDRACDRYDNAQACYEAGIMMLGWDASARDLRALRKYSQRSCQLDKRYCALRGQLHATGVAVKKDQRLAAKNFLLACENGSAESCHISGYRADNAIGMPKSVARAIELWKRACSMSSARSCRFLGDLYREGRGTTKDDKLALRNYQLACFRDDGEGCALAGQLVGKQGPKRKRAERYFRLGCNLASGPGCRHLATMRAADGKHAESLRLFEKGCSSADAPSCETAGDRHYYGQQTPKNRAKAALLFAQACKHGTDKTCHWVDQAAGETASNPANDKLKKLALETLQSACDQDRALACRLLGRIWVHGGKLDTKRVDRGVTLFRKRCDGGDATACLEIGLLYENGIGVVKDQTKSGEIFRRECERNTQGACNLLGYQQWNRGEYEDALTLFHRACEEKDGDACNVEGFAFYTAKGRPWNTAKGVKLYQRSCELGYALGCANVSELYRLGVVVEKDAKKSLEAATKGCTPVEAAGCTWVGRAYHQGAIVDKDLERAEREYKRTCVDESWASAESCLFLAELHEQSGNAPASRIAALRQLAFQLSEKNSKDGGYYHHLTGTLYQAGVATMADPDKAIDHWVQGCDVYDPQSCLAGGTALLAAGPAKRKRAQFMLERACAAGIVGGCERFEESKKPAAATTTPTPAIVDGKKGCAGCSTSDVAGGALVHLFALLALVLGCGRRRRPERVAGR